MIDLHCHILPGLDDGPATLQESLELGRAASRAGTAVIAATPHIREDHPFDPMRLPAEIERLNTALSDAGVAVDVVRGGEVAMTKALELDDAVLRGLCLGRGSYLLVESPYTHTTGLLESTLFELQVRGFRPVLAHPERAPSFHEDPARLEKLVSRGVLCSVTSASMAGLFGRHVHRFTMDLFRKGLVHDVASDAHDPRRRHPDLSVGFEASAKELPDLERHADAFTVDAPRRILAGEEPSPPPVVRVRRRLFRRA
jgi:protein-tyrosine phosphatase